jgi:DNA mismatch endonuclease (patch repair protein)
MPYKTKPPRGRLKQLRRGDIMSPEKRSALMSRIRGRNTGPERVLAEGIRSFDRLWESHARDLPGCPDFVFRESRLVVFVDGDFWHGWRFPAWRHKLQDKWESKIAQNQIRDRRNRAKLRRGGWTVLRIWEHQIEQDLTGCLLRIKRLLDQSNRPIPDRIVGAEPQQKTASLEVTRLAR